MKKDLSIYSGEKFINIVTRTKTGKVYDDELPFAPGSHKLSIDLTSVWYAPLQFIDLLPYGVKLIDHILIAFNLFGTKYYEIE